MDDKNYIREIAQNIRANLSSEDLRGEGLEDLFNTYAVLALVKGTSVTNEDVHDAWAAWALEYYPSNKSLIPYSHLSKSAQDKDSRFTSAIKAVARAL